ncbi:proprotein convertase subtilisin/kexin type 5-like isoform X1 [Montipora foliosa]|uniref:proprotein convertase subtilisin/kexin type 5-like isoform X1 n=1 Tax=Montipora foliosa TaxID=591990 RepID=UPI0035F11A7F
MLHFQVLVLFAVAELTCIRNAVVSGEENSDFLRKNNNFQHRSKRWLWGGCGLIPGCEKCTDGLVCNKCRPSFIPVEYERNRKLIIRCTRSCPLGYNMTSKTPYPALCVRTHPGSLTILVPDSQIVDRQYKQNMHGCLARNCIKCHPQNPTSCLNCSTGFYSLQKKVMGNVRCVRHCPIGSTPTVLSDGRGLCKDPNSKCLSVVPNCVKCLDSVRCRKCGSEFNAFFNKSGMACVRSCPNNLVAVNSSSFGNYCKKPLMECTTVENCVRCPDKINCRRCKPGFFRLKTSAFANSTCVVSCPSGFFKKGRRCHRLQEEGCLDEYCLTCRESWYRSNNNKRRCLRKCPNGFYALGEKQKFCLRCIDNCEQCINGYDCTKCNPQTSRLEQGVQISCSRNCPSGYRIQEVANQGKVCLPRSRT